MALDEVACYYYDEGKEKAGWKRGEHGGRRREGWIVFCNETICNEDNV